MKYARHSEVDQSYTKEFIPPKIQMPLEKKLSIAFNSHETDELKNIDLGFLS